MTEVAYAVDLGGTWVKYGLVTRAGRVLASGAVPTGASRRMAGVRDALREAVGSVKALAAGRGLKPRILGCGSAGTLVGKGGRLVTPSPSLPFMKDFEIAAFLRKEAGVPAVAENDASVAALAEFRLGAGGGKGSLLMATVGTGLGGGLVVNGELIRGRFGTAAEIGHGVFQPDGIACGCGSRGCLEQYAASRALLRFYLGRKTRDGRITLPGPPPRVRDVIAEARAGRKTAREAVDYVGRNLGIGLVTCASLVPVDVIAIGGGMSVLGPLLLRPVRAAFRRHALPYVRKTAKIVRAKLGNQAGFVGAALLAFDALAPAAAIRRARAR